jgi:hypothetical protein
MQADGTVNCIFGNSNELAIMYAGFVSSMRVDTVNCIYGSNSKGLKLLSCMPARLLVVLERTPAAVGPFA